MTPITRETLSKLRELAANATPGPWSADPIDYLNAKNLDGVWSAYVSPELHGRGYRGAVCHIQSCDHIGGIDRNEARANAGHIAACSPDVILALVDEVERLQREIDNLHAARY